MAQSQLHEQNPAALPEKPTQSSMSQGVKIALIIVGGVVLTSLIISMSVTFNRHHAPNASYAPFGGMMQRDTEDRRLDRFDHNERGYTGTITAISSDSITLKTKRDNQDITLKITDSTAITNSEGLLKTEDLKVGDSVRATAKTTAQDTAAHISRQ